MKSDACSPPHIKIEAVSVAFGSNQVLRDINLDLPASSATCLIGLSASGKTVLAKTIAGLITPSQGRVLIDALDLNEATPKDRQNLMRRMGFLFQKAGLFDSLSVWENIAFQQLETRTWTKTQAREQVVELLADVGLDAAVADLTPADLSGGMQKRVGIARAIAGAPDILILDEPTAGLDPIMSRAMCDLVSTLRQRRPMTLITISSDMAVAQRIADTIVMLHDHDVHWQGPAHQAARSGDAAVEQIIASEAEGPLSL